MVHQTMNTSSSNAPRASSKSKTMTLFPIANHNRQPVMRAASLRTALIIATGVLLASCAMPPAPPTSAPTSDPGLSTVRPDDGAALPAPLVRSKSRWVPVRWAELPGFEEDALFEAWNAWLKSCERPGVTFASLCAEVRRLSIASGEEQRRWMLSRLQPYRVEALAGGADGLLTSYYEPLLKASRQQAPGFEVPLYQPPASLGSRKPWYTRQEIDTSAEARAALKGREIAWLADPVEVMSLHIQGSGRLSVTEPDGSQRLIRVAYAGTNDQPFRSVVQWLQEQGEGRMATPWVESTRAWAARNPQRVQQMLWSNPRYTFFQEQPLSDLDATFGPRGAQGVALTPGRSIAVDPGSIPYGTPVWLASRGPAGTLQKLVFAQDTGSAIVGAVRADYFAGTGAEAGLFASRMNQPLRLWVLWPK
ncbi:MltA domain-containing protein [Polaromonas sp. YR568]|uniref:murein transglycosylase A n=1 Tax=Polaromonas sp. YR568 TaxID=1855301 RepID=UPI003137F9FD